MALHREKRPGFDPVTSRDLTFGLHEEAALHATGHCKICQKKVMKSTFKGNDKKQQAAMDLYRHTGYCQDCQKDHLDWRPRGHEGLPWEPTRGNFDHIEDPIYSRKMQIPEKEYQKKGLVTVLKKRNLLSYDGRPRRWQGKY